MDQLINWRGWKPPRLAERLNEHPNWIYNRLDGRVQVKADEIPRIAEALGVSPADFFSEGPPVGSLPVAETLVRRAATESAEAVRHTIAEEVRAALREELKAGGRQPVLEDAKEGEDPRAVEVSRELAQSWPDLPPEERDYIWRMVEARKQLRERTGE